MAKKTKHKASKKRVARSVSKKKAAAPKKHVRRPSKVSGAGMTAVQHKAAARGLLEGQLGSEYVRRDNAKLKRDKKKIGKKITDIKRQLRALK